jgi:hypothetical protein
MRRGDAKHRRAARLTATAGPPPLERAGYARARSARTRRTPIRAKAKLSLGYKEKVMLPVAVPCGSITTV